ncbi:CAP domain-containing protein [Streptococcus sp. 27098_8_73]|uniref:CAP domain-containing protein n=1 Tax=Streptococcus sp. 27098_8_73 TaxID=3003668 RepID=UPI00352C17E1
MDKKIGKSVVATGIAATTIISGALSHQVKADELVESTATKPKATAVTEKPITTADVAEAKEKADAAKKNVNQQQEQTKKAEADFEGAKTAVSEAQEKVATATENEKAATEENISQAETSVKKAEEEVTAKSETVKEAETAVQEASQAVKDQENTIAGQQSLVDVAESELNKAKEPVHAETAAVETAKSQENQAQTAVEHAKNELVKAEQATSVAPQNQAEIQNKINQTQANLEQTKQLITATNTELVHEQKNASTGSVDFRNTTYSQFLENLRDNSNNEAVRNAAADALALYKRGQNEFKITVGSDPSSPASLENNLQALELVKAINAYRRNAGLPELLVDPYANVASQIQTLYFEKANWHMGKLIGNENVAISFDPQGAVNFWHSEKALYQKIAAQYGLPTDERQLDANAIYMKVGAEVFAQIGHYVQMMDNKANAISAAYDTHPNQWGTPHGTSEVGFHNVRNFNQRVNNGTLLTVEAMEKLLRGGGSRGAASSANVTALKNRLAELQAQKVSQESSLNLLNNQLTDLSNEQKNRVATVIKAKQNLEAAENGLALTQQNLSDKKAALRSATARIASALSPYQAKLQKAQATLEEAKNQLAALKTAEENKNAALEAAKAELVAAQNRVVAAKKKVVDLKTAPQQLEKAKQDLARAEADLKAKQALAETENKKLADLQTAYNELLANYNYLQSLLPKEERQALEPVVSTTYQASGVHSVAATSAANPRTLTPNENPISQDEKDAQVEPTANVAAQDQPKTDNNTSATPTPAAPKASANKAIVLPNTGTEADQLAFLGMTLGAALLTGAINHRRRKTL